MYHTWKCNCVAATKDRVFMGSDPAVMYERKGERGRRRERGRKRERERERER